MFKRHDITLMSDPCCSKTVENLCAEDFLYYDKDGFELNIAERKFYSAMNYPLIDCLNHTCWQEPWFKLKEGTSLILDHSMFLCRASYTGDALEQLKILAKNNPQANYLINTRPKWGYDFALDAIVDNNIFEVIHIEYDNLNYDKFANNMLILDYTIRHTDWLDVADKVWDLRNEWQHLQGFEQNNWKAKYILNWSKAEYTEKTLNS